MLYHYCVQGSKGLYILCLLLPWMVRFLLAQIPNLHLSLDKCELPSLWTSPWQIAAQDPGPRIQHFRIPEPDHGPWRNKNSLSRLEIGHARQYIIFDGQAISKNARSKNIFGQMLRSERGRGKSWTQSQEVTQFFLLARIHCLSPAHCCNNLFYQVARMDPARTKKGAWFISKFTCELDPPW